MSLKALAKRITPKTEPANKAKPVAKASNSPSKGTEDDETHARTVAIEKARAATATKTAEKLQAQMAALLKEREAERIQSAILASASTTERRAINPAHIVALKASEFVIHEGKVVSKTDPTKGVDETIAAWLDSEGKYMLAPSMPGGGSGAPSQARPGVQAPPPDLKTDAGLTERARQLTHKMFAPSEPSKN